LLPFEANAAEALPADVGAALAEFRRSIPDNFDRTYIACRCSVLPNEHLCG
jgi:hypothetical protein